MHGLIEDPLAVFRVMGGTRIYAGFTAMEHRIGRAKESRRVRLVFLFRPSSPVYTVT